MPRAYWKGYLQLSLVTCPIELFPATSQAEKTHFHQINTRTGHRLRQQMVDEQTGRVVDTEHKGRGYELGKGHYVAIDEDELKAVVSNLVDNAIKYSGPQVRVAVELEQTDAATITLRVRDEGIGISPTEQKRIFKRFYRIPGVMATRIKGTGLGLFIVRSVVARHGGKVYAESGGPGHGSTFVVQLPLVAPQ